MAFSFFTVLVAFLVASASYIYLLVQHNTPKDGFQPLTVPGPVLLGAATGINLDGLTLIRTVKLPTVVVHLPGVGTIKIKNSTSELVFPKLRAKDVRVHSHDLASSPTTLIATVDAALSGSCAVFLDFVRALSRLMSTHCPALLTCHTDLRADSPPALLWSTHFPASDVWPAQARTGEPDGKSAHFRRHRPRDRRTHRPPAFARHH